MNTFRPSSRINTRRLLVFVIIFAIVGIALLIRSFASGYNLYLTPQTIQALEGNEFSLNIHADVLQADSISLQLTFDKDSFEYVRTDVSNSMFTTIRSENVQGGILKLEQGSSSSLNGKQFIASITFKSLRPLEQSTMVVGGSFEGLNGYSPFDTRDVTIAIQQSSIQKPVRASDTTSPSVRIVSPIENTTTGDSLNIYATSTDDTIVTRMEVAVDNEIIKTVNDSSVQLTLDTSSRLYEKGEHTIEIKAIDSSNNSGSAIAHFKKL